MRVLIHTILIFSSIFAKTNVEVENTNIFTINQDNKIDYNRVRIYTKITKESQPEFLFTTILDNYNYYNFQTNHNQSKIYRSYLKYVNDTHLINIGLQRVPFGVGRVWNPIDIFNPINSTSIETTERKGVKAIRYEYAINDLSNLDITVANNKQAIRAKGYLNIADSALVFVNNEGENFNIIGWELSGELFNTGVELRSEGGSFYNTLTKKRDTEFIIGFDYAFENSLTLLTEYKYSELSSGEFIAFNFNYQLNILTTLNLLYIKSLKDNTSFTTPTITYSLSDEMTLDFGIQLFNQDKIKEFENRNDFAFVKWFVHF